ncbi:DMT family transporter [Iningainema tapete]|uniref:EamA family transporter n=1 Tax=Iningainema tapete BLCC-T55 TaxID=2748662 RepID=A0A8J6XGX2_9CYAN|nr:DMT family transporter [Iningainema tapete]MBD2773035.1 EamA family transporter [Iningainema tapete BLCC-T55]
MGRFDHRSQNPRENEPFATAQTAIKAVTEELQIIQRTLLKSMQEDVKRLQMEKMRLVEDIKRLQDEKEHVQQGRQINEQQALVRQLAQVLANHISAQLQSQLENLANQTMQHPSNVGETESGSTAEKLLGAVDDSVTIAYKVLQQDLKNYQSNLSQQLSRMSVQQQQGEVILAELVNRLRATVEQKQESSPIQELEPAEFILSPTIPESSANEEVYLEDTSSQSTPIVTDTTPKEKKSLSSSPRLPGTLNLLSSGLWLIVLSTVISSVYNVAIKVIFHSSIQMFGLFQVERLLTPTLGNSLFIMMLRMLVVVPLMSLLAPILHPRVWQDLQNLLDSVQDSRTGANVTNQRVLILSAISGCFLFLSQVLLYLAIGQFPTGVAIALFYIYPIVSGLLSWMLRQDSSNTVGSTVRLSLYNTSAIAAISFGCLLLLLGSTVLQGNIWLGASSAIGAGIAFAFYVVLTRICAAKLHPVSFTLINFATMLLLSFIGLILPLPATWSFQINRAKLLEIILSALILGVLTLGGYVLNHFGIRKLGAARSAIFGVSVPVLTVIFAGLIIQETLPPLQILGVLLVTLGAASFSYEKMQRANKLSRFTNLS